MAREHDFTSFLGTAEVLAAWARCREAPTDRSTREFDAMLETYRGCGQRFGLVAYEVALAEAYLDGGALSECQAILVAAENRMRSTGEVGSAPNLLRVKALLANVRGASRGEVEACFDAALESARRYKAKLLEIRIATDLAKWLCRVGRAEHGRERLLLIYQWFAEGLDVPDLYRARGVLEKDLLTAADS